MFTRSLIAWILLASVCIAQSVPAIDARESEWIKYVGIKFYHINSPTTVEYELADESRVDIYKGSIPYEVERAEKWKEGIGQAIFYQAMTDADSAGVILLALNESDKIFVLRCIIACKQAGLTLHVINRHGKITAVLK